MAVADVNLAGQSSGTDPQATAHTAVALYTRSGWSSESAHQQQRSSPQGGCRPQQPRRSLFAHPRATLAELQPSRYPWMGTEARCNLGRSSTTRSSSVSSGSTTATRWPFESTGPSLATRRQTSPAGVRRWHAKLSNQRGHASASRRLLLIPAPICVTTALTATHDGGRAIR